MKIGLAYLPPVLYNALRLLLAATIAWPILLSSGTCRPIQQGDAKRILTISLMGFFFFQVLFTAGLPKTTAGNASLVLALTPVYVAVINRIFKNERLALPVVLGIGVALLGVGLIVLGSGKTLSLASGDLVGALLILAGQAGNGYYVVYSKDLMERYSTYQINTWVMTLSALAFTVISLPDLAALQLSEVPLAAWLSIAVSGTFSLCIGNLLWVWALGRISSTKASLYQYLSPIVSIAAGVLFLGETFGLLQIAGASVIFAGLYLTQQKSLEPSPILLKKKAFQHS